MRQYCERERYNYICTPFKFVCKIRQNIIVDFGPKITVSGKLILHLVLCSSITGGLLAELWG